MIVRDGVAYRPGAVACECGAVLTRAPGPWPSMGGRCSSINASALYQGSYGRTLDPKNKVALPVPRHCPVIRFRRAFADHHLGTNESSTPTACARPRNTERSTRPQACGQLAPKPAAALHIQRLVDRLVADLHRLIVRKVVPQTLRNCSGLHAIPHRRFCRGPCRRPFHGTIGPRTAAPSWATTSPASRSCTYARSAALIASFARFGRRADRSACHCAVLARYSRPPLRVAALRLNSRETVDAARPSRRAISRTPKSCASASAISSRSANAR